MKVVRKFSKNIQLELDSDKFTIKKDDKIDTWSLDDDLFYKIIGSAIFGKIFVIMLQELKKSESSELS